MQITVIGSGYVGLVTGACLAELGHRVACVDKDAAKIAQLHSGQSPIFEPGLETLLTRNQQNGRLSFTTDLAEAMREAAAIFIAVGTPSRDAAGEADLSYVYAAAREIAALLPPERHTTIITKSTVPVGTGEHIRRLVHEANPGARFAMASNPEFLREGSAIHDFMEPDRIIAGADSNAARETLAALYRPFAEKNTPIVYTDIHTAELTKYAANCFLALKVAFINEMSDLCEKLGTDIQEVARGLGLDPRIGQHFLQPGPGYGGSCFPKDTLALRQIAQATGSRSLIIETVIEANEGRKRRMAEKIIAACGDDVRDKKIAALGLTFKAGTDDVRSSPSLTILPCLLEAGAKIATFDPQGMAEAKKLLPPQIQYGADVYSIMKGADALVILTEWAQFKALDWPRVQSLLKTPLVIDLRNLYALDDMRGTDLRYVSLGRPVVG